MTNIERLVNAKSVVGNLSPGPPDGSYAVLWATGTQPAEVSALENGKLRRLSHQNDGWLTDVQLGTTEEFRAKSKDGTEVHGLIVKPGAFQAGQKYPALRRIHGGPNSQDEHAFNFEREFFAARGSSSTRASSTPLRSPPTRSIGSSATSTGTTTT